MIFTKGQDTQAVQNQRKRREFRLWIGFKKMQGHLMLHGIGGHRGLQIRRKISALEIQPCYR